MGVVVVGELDFVYFVVEVDDVVFGYYFMNVMDELLWCDWEVVFFGVVIDVGENLLM